MGCAHQCARETWRDTGGCNAWKFDAENGVCEMGNVGLLEDTNNLGVSVMIRESDIKQIQMVCKGGEHCCSREWYVKGVPKNGEFFNNL